MFDCSICKGHHQRTIRVAHKKGPKRGGEKKGLSDRWASCENSSELNVKGEEFFQLKPLTGMEMRQWREERMGQPKLRMYETIPWEFSTSN